MKTNLRIGEILTEKGYVTEKQISQALAYQKEHRDKRVGQILMELGFVTETQVLEALASRLQLRIVDVAQLVINIEAVAMIDKGLAEKNLILPVHVKDHNMQIVTNDPLNYFALEEVRQQSGCQLEILLSEEAPLKQAISYYFAEVSARRAAKQANVGFSTSSAMAEMEIENLDNSDDEAPIIRLLNSLIERAIKTGASDVHIEPFEKETRVRMRIDGQMVSYLTLEKALHNSIVARIKIMSNLNIAEKRIPQDGNFHAVLEGIDISMRISVLPTTHGEKIVMRYLVSDTKIDHAGHFGMNEYSYNMLMKMMSAPNGIIYITGPTGSGKTTTLYMVLQHLSQRPVNISTIEDPVEKDLPNITQTSVNVTAGMTFAVGLRALLRQDPDIIMIGETRDAETAEISVRSAITGHLVVSTLHTNDAISSIVRLADMGVAPYLISNSVVGIVAQRLVRKVCQFCKYEEPATADDIAIVGDGIPMITRGKGCKVCNNTGYKGRISIHEMVYIDKTLKRMIAKSADSQEMLEYAKKTQGMRSLLDSAIDLVKEGVTTPEEVMKIAYYSD